MFGVKEKVLFGSYVGIPSGIFWHSDFLHIQDILLYLNLERVADLGRSQLVFWFKNEIE